MYLSSSLYAVFTASSGGADGDRAVVVRHNRQSLVKMVAAIRVLPLHLLLDTVKQVIRQPPTVEGFVQVRDPRVKLSIQLNLLREFSTQSPLTTSLCSTVVVFFTFVEA